MVRIKRFAITPVPYLAFGVAAVKTGVKGPLTLQYSP